MSESKNFANEEWMPVVGYEGLYEVSNQGRLRMARAGYRKKAGAILKTPSDGK